MDSDMLSLFRYFVAERWRIHVAKDLEKLPAPWTDDPILHKYRFCNVFREHDKVTMWIKDNWRTPNMDDPLMLYNMAVARIINHPPTLAEIGFGEHNPEHLRTVVLNRQHREEKTFSSAYMVTGTESKGMKKVDFVILLLDRLWKVYTEIAYDSLAHCARSIQVKGISTFLAGQIIADVKYTPWLDVHKVKDWWTWAAPGPGSVRGLHRLHGRSYTTGMGAVQFEQELAELIGRGIPLELHAQDVQNCLCEFDKYCRVKLGQGTPKQLYEQSLSGEY
jgi:alpha-glutamyl/putrescinyl thymine pyrophosphorylase clade 1